MAFFLLHIRVIIADLAIRVIAGRLVKMVVVGSSGSIRSIKAEFVKGTGMVLMTM